MAIYSGYQLTTNVGLGPCADVRASAANSPRVMEYTFSPNTGLQAFMGLGRPANDASVVQTSPVAVLPDNPSDPAGQSTTAIAWTTAPTAPTAYLRRAQTGPTIGYGVIWQFPRGLMIAPSRGIVLFCTNSAPVHNTWAVVDE